MQTLQPDTETAPRVARAPQRPVAKAAVEPESNAVEMGRFQLLAEEETERPKITFAPATIQYAAKFLEQDEKALEAKLENASEQDLLKMLESMGVSQ
eukprot:scaffold53_cov193-Pinguiococcus_pyrenoidosus.AAC.19